MSQSAFADFLINSYITTQFSDVEIELNQSSKSSEKSKKAVKYSNKVRLELPDNKRLIIQRNSPFSSLESGYFEALNHLIKDFHSLPSEHHLYLRRASYNRIIAATFANLHQRNVTSPILLFIEQLEKWTTETYEGNPINASIGLCLSQESGDEDADYFQDIVQHDFSKVISNARDTIVEFDANAQYLGYNVIVPNIKLHTSPVSYTAFAEYTKHGDSMAFVLCSNREILIFSNGELSCAKRRGEWRIFNHYQVIHQLAFSNRKIGRELRQALYESCLDLSFSRSGACIGVIQRNKESQLGKDGRIHEDDRFSTRTSIKSRILGDRCGDVSFCDIDRRIRQEILSIDGATVIDATGQVIAAGSILSLNAGSVGGARLAAAKCLSQYGLAIKVSSDGEIRVFGNKQTFNFG